MKKTTRWARCAMAWALLAAMIFGAAACSGGDNGGGGAQSGAAVTEAGATVADTSAAVAETKREETRDTLPELNFNGLVVGVDFPESHGGKADQIDWALEDTGDVVSAAVYNRQVSVEDRLNVKFKIEWSQKVTAYENAVRTDVTSGTGTWDILYGPQSVAAKLVTEGIYLDMADAKYIDYDQPWWDGKVLDEMTVHGRRYMLTGDVSLSMLSYISCYYFNKDQWEAVTGKKDNDLYQLVLDGKWTMDALGEYCAASYKDVNGDGKKDENDTFGTGTVTASTTDHMTFDSGIRFITFNKSGIPELTMNNERTVLYAEKLCKLFYDNPGVLVFPSTQDVLRITLPGKFMNNELTFMSGYYYSASLLREMKGDYGIIPYPKLDEKEPSYHALFHNSTQLISVPVTCKKGDEISACIEAIAAENYRTVTPAYYDVALKAKYTRDQISGQIIDLIHDGITTDFAYVYSSALGGAGLIMRTVAEKNDPNFASLYASNEASYKQKLTDLIAAFEKVG